LRLDKHQKKPRLLGCDFTSSPGKRKPIVVALGSLHERRVELLELLCFETLNAFSNWLAAPLQDDEQWLGGFDLPFGLPRELVNILGWPSDWASCMDLFCSLSRAEVRNIFAAFCNSRPVGQKFAHRATDLHAKSSPSMKWVNPPVAYMMHAGVPILRGAKVHLPGVMPEVGKCKPQKIAVEAYPGLLAREVLGTKSYKSDDKSKQNSARLIARRELLSALEQGKTRLGLRLATTHGFLNRLADDPSGDALDATLCLVQAAWAQLQLLDGHPQYGLPAFDPIEGWIATS
jgi:hypothetical protein